MNKKINYDAIVIILLVVAMLFGGGIYTSKINDLKNTVSSYDSTIANKDADISRLAEKVSSLSEKISDAQTLSDITSSDNSVDDELSMYLVDGYFIGDSVDEKLSDRELSLFDGKIEYDDDEYNADEYLIVNGKFVSNEDEMGSDVYMAFKEGDIKYNFVFDDSLDMNDESLDFNFLGDAIEVTDWNTDEITIKMADEMIVSEGDTVYVDNNSVLLDMVMDGSVWITSNGKSEKIYEDKCKDVGDVEVCVSDVLYSEKDTRVSKAVLSIASDVMETIDSGDQYGDSVWNWYVDYPSRTIGLVLSEDFRDLDEDFTPLGVDNIVCLPSDYVCIKFNGLSDEDMSDISLKYDLSDDETKISGDFEDGTNDLDELIVNSSGMYYENDDNDMVMVTSVKLKDTDNILNYSDEKISIGDIEMFRNIEKVSVNGKNVTDEDSYRSIYGSILEIDNDLESNDDNDVSISVPEEKLETSFFVY